MHRAARATLPRLLGVFSIVHFVLGSEYGVPIEIKLWDTGRTPLSHMVDVTNEFGLKILAEHNFLNDNNIAFSPYGLMGILVALYEGVDGESSYQIQKGMQLPWNRNVMRIGFRDIHRTLKTYFVPEEGFLAGLALNNENVTFNESYKKILRFYGFDLNNEKLPSLPPSNDTRESTTSSEAGATTVATSPSTQPREEPSTPARELTTTNPNAETINDVDIRMPTSSPTPESSAASNAESTTTPAQTETTTGITTADLISSTLAKTATTTTEPTTEVIQSIVTENTMPTVVVLNSAETTTASNPTASANEATEMLSTDGQMSPSILVTVGDVENTTDLMTTAQESESTEQPTTVTSSTTESGTTESTMETLQRRKKSIVNFIFTSPPYIHDNVIYRAFDIPVPVQNTQNSNPGADQMFLANGLKSVQVSYMHYDAVLEHAYLPHLEAAALRLPLDSERYYLLALLPSRAHPADLARLLARLARRSDLRDVYAALRPRRVRAIVPSFTVKGHVTLTADLQKLGIRDVFEPRQHDFTPMTPQLGVYVRSIEQAVSVAIRKYGTDDRNSSRYVSPQPVHFSATYPFLYFVMDASIHVALMAGKMVDPLNSRIL